MITINSYFSGAGLGDLGLIKAGLHINQAFELDKSAVKTYRRNIGDHVKHCDLTEELVLEQDSCHGMIFTYPCTRYSRIGDISDTRTGDDLFLHALRHLAIAKPEFYMVENVVGMKEFPIVMEAMTRLSDYYINVFSPVKTQVWLPQIRDRLFIFGTRRPFSVRPPENTTKVTLASILEKEPEITYPISIRNRLLGKYRDKPIISDPSKNDNAPTCIAHYSKDKSTRLVVDKRYPFGVRPYSVREWARLQGVPDSFHFPVSPTEAYKQIGNGVPIPAAEWGAREMIRYMKLARRIHSGTIH